MRDINVWVREVREQLAELMTQDFGYDIHPHEIGSPVSSIPPGVPVALHPMYRAFDGLSMPNVHNGYFIDTADRVVTAAERGLPTRISSEPGRLIHVFGSDGGGNLFAVRIDDGAVLFLDSDGCGLGGTFAEHGNVRARRIAGGMDEFLELLKRDVEAFVSGVEGHAYLTQMR